MNAGFLQQIIARKLSSLLGVTISFDKLSLSILGGSIEASGITIASPDHTQIPLLTISRVRAEIAVARAIKGEIAVKSLAIEKPAIRFVRRAGQTNLPKRPTPPAPPSDTEAKPEKASRKLDVEKILILDGSAAAEIDERSFHADKLLAELKRASDGYELTLLAEEVSLVGSIRGHATLAGVSDLAAFPSAALTGDVSIGDIGQIRFATPRIGARDEGEISFHGGITLAKLHAILREAGWG